MLEMIIHIVDPLARIPESLDELQSLYHSTLQGKRCLIFADHIVDAESIEAILPPPSSKLLITSRKEIDVSDQIHLHLEDLSERDAELLLQTICPRLNQDAIEVARLCRNNPRALRLSASLLAHDPSIKVDDYIGVLKQQIQLPPHEGEDLSRSIKAILRYSYKYLDADSREHLKNLVALRGSFDRDEAEAVSSTAQQESGSSEAIEENLNLFVRLSLVQHDAENDLYKMCEDVREIARHEFNDEVSAHIRLARFLCDVTERLVSLGSRSSDGFVVSTMSFDYYKLRFKQCLAWIEQQPSSVEMDSLALNLIRVPLLYKQLRFHPSFEVVPHLQFALESSQRLQDIEMESKLMGVLETYTS